MTDRYERLFSRLKANGEGAFIPFCVVGDPNPAVGRRILSTLAGSGADALELGIAFSDPVADGPTIQKADQRALDAGMRPAMAWEMIREVRDAFPELPIGLLVYANLVVRPGIDRFYHDAAAAGVDSVLVADVPTIEASPFVEIATANGVAPVFIAAPNCDDRHLAQVAKLSAGYTYLVTRTGVTGADAQASTAHVDLVARMARLDGPPCVMGFGISRPRHVREALAAGAAGAISGSAVVNIIDANLHDVDRMQVELAEFVKQMKAATV